MRDSPQLPAPTNFYSQHWQTDTDPWVAAVSKPSRTPLQVTRQLKSGLQFKTNHKSVRNLVLKRYAALNSKISQARQTIQPSTLIFGGRSKSTHQISGPPPLEQPKRVCQPIDFQTFLDCKFRLIDERLKLQNQRFVQAKQWFRNLNGERVSVIGMHRNYSSNFLAHPVPGPPQARLSQSQTRYLRQTPSTLAQKIGSDEHVPRPGQKQPQPKIGRAF